MNTWTEAPSNQPWFFLLNSTLPLTFNTLFENDVHSFVKFVIERVLLTGRIEHGVIRTLSVRTKAFLGKLFYLFRKLQSLTKARATLHKTIGKAYLESFFAIDGPTCRAEEY